jgi:hypothetical protein
MSFTVVRLSSVKLSMFNMLTKISSNFGVSHCVCLPLAHLPRTFFHAPQCLALLPRMPRTFFMPRIVPRIVPRCLASSLAASHRASLLRIVPRCLASFLAASHRASHRASLPRTIVKLKHNTKISILKLKIRIKTRRG